MKKYYFFLLLTLAYVNYSFAQGRELKEESTVTTNHTVNIKSKIIPYSATAGTQPVWDEDGKLIASLFYTYYKRSDIKNNADRPLLISFNGGPGSASAWMHIAYTGPRLLNIDDEGYPVQPYGVKENPYSILDIADIVYVNPVNTGYSRIINTDKEKKVDRNKFFGINADIKYLAEWINTFITRNNRWRSPKFLIGESYGGTRVSGLALELQNVQWIYLNGVILVSPADYKVLRTGGPVSSGLDLPYFTAAAWYQKALGNDLQQKDLTEILPEVEKYTIDEVIPALTRGGFIDSIRKKQVAAKMAYYSGLSEKFILQNNLDIPTQSFWKELKRDKGFTIGRLDSRYLGIDKSDAGSKPDYNAELTSWLHSFTPAINYYLREQLNYKTDIKYNMFGPVHPWDNSNNNTRENLRQAMAQNPYLNILFQAGYYDGATTYFKTKYTMWQLDPSGRLKDRMDFKGYRSGHMMYLRKEDLAKASEDIRMFIKKSLPKKSESAKY